MVVKIYGAPNTGNCMRAVLALFEALIEAKVDIDTLINSKEVQLVLVDLKEKDQEKPEYLAKNPLGRVPCLKDGDVILFESRAIARYLAEKYGLLGLPFLGNTLKEKATINQWCEVEGQNFMPPVGCIFREVFKATSNKQDLDENAKNCIGSWVPDVVEVLDIYEDQLSKFKYIAGDEYTLADQFHIPYLHKLMDFKHMDFKREVFGNHKHVTEWAKCLINRPAFQETLKKDSLWSKESLKSVTQCLSKL